MLRSFYRLLNIRASEQPRFLILYVMLFVSNAGTTWGRTILYAAFLDSVGVQALPWVMIASAVLSIVVSSVYAAFADRLSNDTLLIFIMLGSALGIVLGWAGLVQASMMQIASFFLYLFFLTHLELVNVHWTTYVNGFYDTQSAKRLFSAIASAGRFSAIFAGFTMPLLTGIFPSSTIVLIWLATVLFVAVLAWAMPSLLHEPRHYSERATLLSGSPASYFDNLREGNRFVNESPFLRWVAVSAFTLMVLFSLINYQSSVLFKAELGTTKAIADWTGLLSALTNLLALPIQLFLISRIIKRFGVGNTSLIYPGGTLAIVLSMVAFPNVYSASAGFFQRTAFRTSFQAIIDGLLYNAVPLRIKGRARAFVGGVISPLGSLMGSLVLLAPILITPIGIGVLLTAAAVAYVVAAFNVRREYTTALLQMLEQEDYSFLLAQQEDAEEVTVADPATLNSLKQKLAASDNPEITLFIAKLIGQVASQEAAPILGQAARDTQDPRVRSLLLDTLASADTGTQAAQQVYAEFLNDPDGRVRQSALAGLYDVYGANSSEYLALAERSLNDPDIEVRAQLLPALLRSNNPAYQAQAAQVVSEMLASAEPVQRRVAARVLAEAGSMQFVEQLVGCLEDPADEVRLEAAQAIEALARKDWPPALIERVKEQQLPRLHDPIERVRQIALTVLGRLGGREAYAPLIEALTDPSPQIRATAVEALVEAGQAVVPALYKELDSTVMQTRKMAAVVLTRIDPKEYSAAVQMNITRNLLDICRNQGLLEALAPCSDYRSVALVGSGLRERNRELLDELFYFLAARHGEATVKVVADSLHSDDPRMRANAAEALETLTTTQTAQLIASLHDPEVKPAHILRVSADIWDMQHPDTLTAIRQLHDNVDGAAWARPMMTYALGEMGARLPAPAAGGTAGEPPAPAAPAAAPPAAPEGGARGRRGRRPSLLDALAGGDSGDKAKAAEEPSPPPPRAAGGTEGVAAPGYRLPMTRAEVEALLQADLADSNPETQEAATSAMRLLADSAAPDQTKKERAMLSTIEKIIFLKEVPFFQGMTVNQLKILANVCEEQLFNEDERIFNQGDAGGVLYVVVTGKVALEQEKRKGSFARLGAVGPHSYFGEMNLFDNSPRTVTALAIQDTLTLRLRREPLIALARQYPDLSLELINVLSARLREINDRVGDLARTKTRELQKFFDRFEEQQKTE
jgi:CRP-like cAMP-binding protein/HEAT repeat protein/ATP/ADP translocase